VAEQDFQTSGSELVQAASDAAALVELNELESQAQASQALAGGQVDGM